MYATFKTYKLGNAQTIETVKKNNLDFRISHRFGNVYNMDNGTNALNEAAHSYFGFDNASDIRWSFDYGITDNLTIGVGRSRFKETYDGSIKWKLISQKEHFAIPVSVTFFADMGYTSVKPELLYAGAVKNFPTNDMHRFSYFTQLIIASKLTDCYLSKFSHRTCIVIIFYNALMIMG